MVLINLVSNLGLELDSYMVVHGKQIGIKLIYNLITTYTTDNYNRTWDLT